MTGNALLLHRCYHYCYCWGSSSKVSSVQPICRRRIYTSSYKYLQESQQQQQQYRYHHYQNHARTSSLTFSLLRSTTTESTTTTSSRKYFASSSTASSSSSSSLTSNLKQQKDHKEEEEEEDKVADSTFSIEATAETKESKTSRDDLTTTTTTTTISHQDAISRLLHLSRPEWNLIGLSAATLGITSSITLLFPFASGQVIDYVVLMSDGTSSETNNGILSPILLASGLFSLSAIAGGGVYLRSLWLARAGNRIVARLKQRLVQSILQQEHAYLVDQQTSGDLLSRLTTDASLVQAAVTSQAVSVLRGSIMTLGSMSMLWYTSPILASISCCTLPPIFIVTRHIGRHLQVEQEQVQKLQGIATTIAEESISNISTVKQFVAEQYESTHYRNAIAKAHLKALDTAHLQAQLESGAHIAGNGAVLCVLGYGGSMVVDGTISAGDLTGFIMYSFLLAGNISGLTSLYGDLVRASAASNRVFDILDRIPKITSSSSSSSSSSDSTIVEEDDPLQQIEFTPITSLYDSYHNDNDDNAAAATTTTNPVSIDFQSVHFRYPSRPQVQVLDNFSLSVRPGEVVALVGGSGSGKSTISNLLTRLYDVDDDNYKDSIQIAGKSIQEYNLLQLRQMIGIVSQEPSIFRGTIRDNIIYGEWNRISDEQIIYNAAKAAHVLDFTNDFPLGLDTIVGGGRGSQLSGGQKQRIAIARVIVKNPPLVILDEATSALDAKSEHIVQTAMNSLLMNGDGNRTVLSIAHRLSTIRHADRIAVMEHGSIVQIGTFEELSLQDGHFRDLMKTQLVMDDNK